MEAHLKELSIMHQGLHIKPDDELVQNPTIGTKYHLSWASSRGMVWVLKDIIDGQKALLQTPKTKKFLLAKLIDLRETNKTIVLKARKRARRLKKNETKN